MSAVITDRYDFRRTHGGTGYRISVAGYSAAWVADDPRALRPVEIGEATYSRAEARELATTLLAVLDKLDGVQP